MSGRDRVALVTGGAQGIGRRTAEVLAERGFRMAVIDLREATATVEGIRQHGGEAMAFAGDVTDENAVERFRRAGDAGVGACGCAGEQRGHQPDSGGGGDDARRSIGGCWR